MGAARASWLCLTVLAAQASAQVVVTSTDARWGVPSFAWTVSRQSLRGAPVENARRYLLEFAELYRLTGEQIARAEVEGVHDLHDGTAVIVTFTQRVEHVRVFLDEVKVIMTAKGELVAISGHLTPRVNALGGRRLTDETALQTAWAALEGRSLEPARLRRDRLEGRDTWWTLAGAREPARSRPVWFAEPAGLVPAFWVELAGERAGLHSFVVSAIDGVVLFRHDLTASHSYLVFADPTTLEPWPGPRGSSYVPWPGPNTPEPPIGQPALISLLHAGISTQDPWLAPTATELRGNNVVVSQDLRSPNGFNQGDEYVPVSAAGTFDWAPNFQVSPLSSIEAGRPGAVHHFYVTNYLHDLFYDDGFDELSRNAQEQNFGRGGAGNDALLADTLDWSWSDNATMATPADGRSPRMTHFVWGNFPAIDGAFDTGVTAHEFGHLISNRLIGDGDGLNTLQGGGLGEGWGDFHAALLLATEEDAALSWNTGWQGSFSLATWVVDGWLLRYGLRRWPLSSSFSYNPLTFRHISDGEPLPTSAPHSTLYGPNAEVHNTGEIWAVMLWDCYTSLLADQRLSFTQARARMRKYLVGAYKATALSPTFVDARDAVLAVAAANDPLDYVSFWDAFARRGIGFRALAPYRFGSHNSPLLEDFTVGAVAQLTEPVVIEAAGSCDGDGVLDVDEPGRVRVRVRNLGTVTMSSLTVRFSSGSPNVVFPRGDSLTLTNIAPFATVDAEVDVAISGRGVQQVTLTAAASASNIQPTSSTAQFVFNTDVAMASSSVDDVEPPVTVWVPGVTPSRDPGFAFSRRRLTSSQHVWWAPAATSGFEFFLTSPPLVVGPSGLRVNFRHRFDFDRDGLEYFDGAVVEVSTDDGATWLDVGGDLTPPYMAQLSAQQGSSNPLAGRSALVGQSPNYPAFNNATIDLTALAGRTVRLRFRSAGDDALHQVADGWELDDLQFVGLAQTPFPSIIVDPNRCSNEAPVADAGADFAVDEGARVVLMGSASDREGAPVTLRWSQLSGPLGVLQNDVFIAPEVSVDTPVTLQLIANDGRVDSTPDEVEVVVRNVNRPPTLTVPAARSVAGGDSVSLTVTARDADGDPLTIEWSQQSGPAVLLSGERTATVAFVAPAASGVAQQVVLSVIARDAVSSSAEGRVVVTVEATPVEEEPQPPPRACGCSSPPLSVLGAVALTLLWRRRREAPGR